MKTYSNHCTHPAVTEAEYQTLYQQSLEHPDAFWSDMASKQVSWHSPWQTVCSGSLQAGNVKWFEGATLNVCYNCVDRHLIANANTTALIWECDDPNHSQKISYQALYHHVCRFANVLKQLGVKKGDRVCIYMPMIPEAAYAMLACTRIGAVHSVVFGGFSAHALRDRILDANCQIVITADEGMRGGKAIALKKNVDEAIEHCKAVRHVVVIKYTEANIAWNPAIDVDYHAMAETVDDHCDFAIMQAEDPLFILYTSGSTGKPKGIVHTTAGYLVYVATTFFYTFAYQPHEVYWCTADIGWITGHSYILYGPLANAATTLMFEGIPTYPDSTRFWHVIDKHRVNIFYTAPTALRSLMREGDTLVRCTDRSSLRLLGTVGEPIDRKSVV